MKFLECFRDFYLHLASNSIPIFHNKFKLTTTPPKGFWHFASPEGRIVSFWRKGSHYVRSRKSSRFRLIRRCSRCLRRSATVWARNFRWRSGRTNIADRGSILKDYRQNKDVSKNVLSSSQHLEFCGSNCHTSVKLMFTSFIHLSFIIYQSYELVDERAKSNVTFAWNAEAVDPHAASASASASSWQFKN